MVEGLLQSDAPTPIQSTSKADDKLQHASNASEARQTIALERQRRQHDAAVLTGKGTLPSVDVGGESGTQAPLKIDTSGPGWVKHTGTRPTDNYTIRSNGNHEYDKVYADGTIEQVTREGDEGYQGQLDKTITYPNGSERSTVVHVDEHEHWTEDPSGSLKDSHGVVHHWGPKPEDNYAIVHKDASHWSKVYADGTAETHLTRLDPKTHQQTAVVLYTNQGGQVIKEEQSYPDRTMITTTRDRVEMQSFDADGNSIQMSKTKNGKAAIGLYKDGQREPIGPDEIPPRLRDRYNDRVAHF